MRKLVFVLLSFCFIFSSCEMPINVAFENNSDFDLSLTVEDFKKDVTFVVERKSTKYVSICRNSADVKINSFEPVIGGYKGSHNYIINHMPKNHIYIKNTTDSAISYKINSPYISDLKTIAANDEDNMNVYFDTFTITTDYKFYTIEKVTNKSLLEPDYDACYSLIFY